MYLPWMTTPLVLLIVTPAAVLPEMMLRAAAVVPPTVTDPPCWMLTPLPLPSPDSTPVRPVPMKLPTIWVLFDPLVRMPALLLPEMTLRVPEGVPPITVPEAPPVT